MPAPTQPLTVRESAARRAALRLLWDGRLAPSSAVLTGAEIRDLAYDLADAIVPALATPAPAAQGTLIDPASDSTVDDLLKPIGGAK